MSVYMLDDDMAINQVNPYVMRDFSLPGTVRRNERSLVYPKAEEGVAQFEVEEESPICSRAKTAGDLTIDYCTKKDSLCPMSRPFYPERNIDTGFTRPQKVLVEKVNERRRLPMWALPLLVLIVLILLISRR